MSRSYEMLVSQFLYEQFPFAADPPKGGKCEAVSAAVVGTKQRRYGPSPSPETLVAVRDVVRKAEGGVLAFLVPWGSRKVTDRLGFDVLELMAMKQLRCLKDEVERYGQSVHFTFRVEDLTDRFLFPDRSISVSDAYTAAFERVVRRVVGGCSVVKVVRESMLTTWDDFNRLASSYAPVFYRYFRGYVNSGALAEIGWKGDGKGDVPVEQRDHYRKVMNTYYEREEEGGTAPGPVPDPDYDVARYFAQTLAKKQLNATADPTPDGNFLQIAFNHPAPGDPTGKPRLYYRSIPERFTNTHRTPWNAKGYFSVNGETDEVTPKSAAPGDRAEFVRNRVRFAGTEVEADYLLV